MESVTKALERLRRLCPPESGHADPKTCEHKWNAERIDPVYDEIGGTVVLYAPCSLCGVIGTVTIGADVWSAPDDV